MQIHFWQQFSSNHSAFFTVVGLFESKNYASQAADKLRASLLEMIEENQRIGLEESDVEWLRRPEDAVKAVSQLDRLVMISSGRTWDRPATILKLMAEETEAMAVHHHRDGDYRYLHLTMKCKAPTIPVSRSLYEVINTYFKHKGRRPPPKPPWLTDREKLVGASGTIVQREDELTLAVQFFDPNEGLVALLGYLKLHGCSQFDYSIKDSAEWIAE